ncbi:MAG TPA: hypothetical protein VJU82_03450 [Acidobacteriaceae bacterium]|nr:hypothetical protein [Acidobacteriaceae bacterium]
MGQVNMKGATPVGSASLCRTCSHAHILSGYRESEVMVVCTATYPDFPVPFVVRECTGYNDRNRPDWDAMEKLAINVAPVSFAKKVGFNTPLSGREAEPVTVND